MRKYFPMLILLGCVILLVFGIAQLFELRFEAGDVYPPYSSLRADPLGTMAFYESLGKLPGMAVRRDFSILNRLPDEPGTTYLHLAAESYEWHILPEDEYQNVKNYLAGGGRLVITFFPQTRPSYHFPETEDKTNSTKSADLKPQEPFSPPKKSPKKNRPPKAGESWKDLAEEWGLHESFEELPQGGETYTPVSVRNETRLPLPAVLEWHSGLIFTNCDPAWQVIYGRGKHAVVLERKFGKGSVVLASDSYFLSNEAMVKNRHAEFLAWLVGAGSQVVFDEAHLGIMEAPGVAGLMRQYRLHGVAAGLLLLAGLFIWKNSTSLRPPPLEESREEFVAGKDSASGFVNLLRRNISPRDVLGVCFAEWKKTAAPSGQFSNARLQQAGAVFEADNSGPAARPNPLATYKKISETLGTRRHKL